MIYIYFCVRDKTVYFLYRLIYRNWTQLANIYIYCSTVDIVLDDLEVLEAGR